MEVDSGKSEPHRAPNRGGCTGSGAASRGVREVGRGVNMTAEQSCTHGVRIPELEATMPHPTALGLPIFIGWGKENPPRGHRLTQDQTSASVQSFHENLRTNYKASAGRAHCHDRMRRLWGAAFRAAEDVYSCPPGQLLVSDAAAASPFARDYVIMLDHGTQKAHIWVVETLRRSV